MNDGSANKSPEKMLSQLSKVKLLSLDVDGVMTDGGLYYTANGEISRKYNVKDGVGIKRVMAAGVEVTIISAGVSGSIPERAETLGIKYVFTGVDDKKAVLEGLCAELGIGLDEAAHMGDDINDAPLLDVVGCPIAVADAEPEALDAALIVTKRMGGKGAIREVCNAICKAIFKDK
ncbi:MAG: HAD hydrolase family protein [Proteobacteria bacterium]|nr:HAD hydrolase family protein [Pseudomonadota bacterium]MDA1024058.1 HAD hydrolase family protein [Pseudomonadota bacterium]